MPETVRQPGPQQFRHFVALLLGKSGIVLVRGRIFDIDFLVGDIEVAADNHRFFHRQPPDMVAERIFPLHAVLQAGQPALRVRRVYVDQLKIGEFQGDDPPFLVVFGDSHPVSDR